MNSIVKFLHSLSTNQYVLAPVAIIWLIAFGFWLYHFVKQIKNSEKYNAKIYHYALITIIILGMFMAVVSSFGSSDPQEQTAHYNREKLVDLQFQQTQLQIKMEQHPNKVNQYEHQWKQNQLEINKLTNYHNSYLDD